MEAGPLGLLWRMKDQGTRTLGRGVVVAMDALRLKGEYLEFSYVILDHEHTTNAQLLGISRGLQWVLDVED